MLEFSQYLENYLWPNYSEQQSSFAHMMSIVCMLNEKFRERVPAWEVCTIFKASAPPFSELFLLFLLFSQAFKRQPDHFPQFFDRILEICLSDDPKISLAEHTLLIVFLTHCFNSMEEVLIRDQVKKLVSLLIWMSLQQVMKKLYL